MKFLLFNAAVIAALVYLFGMDRGELDAVSDQLEQSAEGLDRAKDDAVDKALDLLGREPAPADPPARDDAEAEAASAKELEPREASAEVTDRKDVDQAPALPAEPAPKTADAASTDAERESATGEAGGGVAASALPALTDPAVARRRAEVLDGLAVADRAPSMALAEGERLMSPEQRVRELHALAEEMELLFVNKMTP